MSDYFDKRLARALGLVAVLAPPPQALVAEPFGPPEGVPPRLAAAAAPPPSAGRRRRAEPAAAEPRPEPFAPWRPPARRKPPIALADYLERRDRPR